MARPDENIKNLYNAFVEMNYEVGTEEDFAINLTAPENRRAVYDAYCKEYEAPPFNVFESRLGYGNYSMATGLAGSAVGARSGYKVQRDNTDSIEHGAEALSQGQASGVDARVAFPHGSEEPYLGGALGVEASDNSNADAGRAEASALEQINEDAVGSLSPGFDSFGAEQNDGAEFKSSKQREFEALMEASAIKEDVKPERKGAPALQLILDAGQMRAQAGFDRLERQGAYTESGSFFGGGLKEDGYALDADGNVVRRFMTPLGSTGDKAQAALERELELPVIEHFSSMTTGGQLANERKRLNELTLKRNELQHELTAEYSDRFKLKDNPFLTYTPTNIGDLDPAHYTMHPEYRQLQAAIRQSEERIAKLERTQDVNTGKDVGFWRGFTDVVTDYRTWTLTPGLVDAVTAYGIKGKLDRGEKLTATEQSLLSVMADNAATGDVDNMWYSAGVMGGYMPKFMLDIALVGGADAAAWAFTNRLTEGMLRQLPKQVSNKITRWAVKAAGATPEMLARGAILANTVQAPKTAADVVNRRMGTAEHNEKGNVEFVDGASWASALYQAEGDAIVEGASEMSGRFIEPALKGVAKRLFNGKAITAAIAAADRNGLRGMRTATNRFMQHFGFNGIFGEIGEEYAGQLARTIGGLDGAYDQSGRNNFLNLKWHRDIWVGMALTMPLISAAPATFNAGRYGWLRHRVNRADARGNALMGERWDAFRAEVDQTDNSNMQSVLGKVLDDDATNNEQKIAQAEYIESTLNLRGFNLGEMADARTREAERAEAENERYYLQGLNASASERSDIDAVARAKALSLLGALGVDVSALSEASTNDIIYQANTELHSRMGYADVSDMWEARALAEEKLTPDVAAVALDYLKASEVQRGAARAVEYEIDEAVAAQIAFIDLCTASDGMIHQAVMTDGTSVFVRRGTLKLSAEGNVDRHNSDRTLIVVDVNGRARMISPLLIKTASMPVSADESKAAIAEIVRRQLTSKSYPPRTSEATEASSSAGNSPQTASTTKAAQTQAPSAGVANAGFDIGDEVQLGDGRRGVIQGIDNNGASTRYTVEATDADGNPQVVTVDGSGMTAVAHSGAEAPAHDQTANDTAADGAEAPVREQTGGGTGAEGDGGGSGLAEADRGNQGEAQTARQNVVGRSLTSDEAQNLITDMEKYAEVAPELPLTPQNWAAEFGADGVIITPIGEVKQGDNQYLKLAQQGRNGKLGMIKPTLEHPHIIIEDERASEDGNSERASSYVFIRTFVKKDGSRYYHFASITVSKEGKEVVISSQERSANRISKLLQQGKVTWIDEKFSLHPTTQIKESVPLNDSNRPTSTDIQPALLGINSSEPNISSDRKVSNSASEKQEGGAESSAQDAALARVPMDESGKRQWSAVPADTAWDALTQVGGGEAAAEMIAAAQIEQAQKALDALSKKAPMYKKPKLQGDPFAMAEALEGARKAYEEALADYESRMSEAAAQLDTWKAIAAVGEERTREAKAAAEAEAAVEHARRERLSREAEAARIAEASTARQERLEERAGRPGEYARAMSGWEEPTTLEEYILRQLCSGSVKLRWSDKGRSRGLGKHITQGVNLARTRNGADSEYGQRAWMIDDRDGLLPETYAERLCQEFYNDYELGGDHYTEVFGELLELCSGYATSQSMYERCKELHAQNLEMDDPIAAEMRARGITEADIEREADFKQRFGMTDIEFAELYAAHGREMDMGDAEYSELMANLAGEIADVDAQRRAEIDAAEAAHAARGISEQDYSQMRADADSHLADQFYEQDRTAATTSGQGGTEGTDNDGGAVVHSRGLHSAGRSRAHGREGVGAKGLDDVPHSDVQGREAVGTIDPREMSAEERTRRGDMLRNADAVNVDTGVITAQEGRSARKVAEEWWDKNVGEPVIFDTEAGEVEIDKTSIKDSLSHGYRQEKLDAVTSLAEGFRHAVYLGSMEDFNRPGVTSHYFVYPINYEGQRRYVFCRAMADNNKNRLYVHEVFMAEGIKESDTLQTIASASKDGELHGGIALYKAILKNVLDVSEDKGNTFSADNQKNNKVQSDFVDEGGAMPDAFYRGEGVAADGEVYDLLKALVESTGLSVIEVGDAESRAMFGNKGGRQLLRTSKGIVYGWVADGKIYLNRDAMNPETPVHEYTHLWDDMVRRENPALWERGKELLRQTPLWKDVVNDPSYADIAADEDAVASEVHARLTGTEGASRLKEMIDAARGKGAMETAEAVTFVARIKAWLGDMFKAMKATLSRWSRRELDELTLEDFNNLTLRDLAEGVNPRHGDRNLVAVHNLSEANLSEALALGGFPMPSIAVTKTGVRHTEFGEISLVFGKDSINPADRRNKVYGGDAWTPTFPSVGYKINSAKAYEIYERADKAGRLPMFKAVDFHPDNYERLIGSGKDGSLVEVFMNDYRAKQLFLSEKGNAVEEYEKREVEKYSADDVGLYEKILKAIGEDRLRNEPAEDLFLELKQFIGEHKGKDMDSLKPFVVKALVNNTIRKALDYADNGNFKTETDLEATRAKIDQRINQQEYQTWLENMFAGVVEKKGIRNDRDMFTPSGSRRKWESLYDAVTLDNVVKAMQRQAEKGGSGFLGGSIFGASTKEFKDIEDIRREAASRIASISPEEYQAEKDRITSRLDEISLPSVEHGGFSAAMDFEEDVREAVVKSHTAKGIYRYLSAIYPDMTMDVANEIADVVGDIQKMNTRYFEAKPHRAVGFEEVRLAVVPEGTSQEIISGLESRGIPVRTYERGNEQQRGAIIARETSERGLRFHAAMARGGAEFDAVRDRAVAERGIVMPGLNEAEVRVVDVPRHDFISGKPIAEAKKWAKQNIVGIHTLTDSNGNEVAYAISGKGIEKYLSETAVGKSDNLGVHLSVLKVLPQVIGKSIEAEIHPDYIKGKNGIRTDENGINPNNLIHRFYGAIKIDSDLYRVKTTIIENGVEQKNKPHSYEVTNVELINDAEPQPDNHGRIGRPRFSEEQQKSLLEAPSDGVANNSGEPLAMTSNSSISAAKLLKGVEKSYDKGKYLLDESEFSEGKAIAEEQRQGSDSTKAAAQEQITELERPSQSNEAGSEYVPSSESDARSAGITVRAEELKAQGDVFAENYNSRAVAVVVSVSDIENEELSDVAKRELIKVLENGNTPACYSVENKKIYIFASAQENDMGTDYILFHENVHAVIDDMAEYPAEKLNALAEAIVAANPILADDYNRTVTEYGRQYANEEFIAYVLSSVVVNPAWIKRLLKHIDNNITSFAYDIIDQITAVAGRNTSRFSKPLYRAVQPGASRGRGASDGVSGLDTAGADAEGGTDAEGRGLSGTDARSARTTVGEMADHVEELASKLHLDKEQLEIVTDASQLEGKQAKAKGFYNSHTGKITIVIPNHADLADVEATVLHEGVVHKGLRNLVGAERMDAFLDGIYDAANSSVRRAIAELASHNGWNFRRATEEYMAELGERIGLDGFERMSRDELTFWGKVKATVQRLLDRFIKGLSRKCNVVLGDRELGYILWRSWKNAKAGGMDLVDKARDAGLRHAMSKEASPSASEQSLSQANDWFNKQLERYISGTMPKQEILHLGKAKGVMRLFLPDLPIVMRQRILSKASETKHNVALAALTDLPDKISHPIFVFQRNEKAIGILTEIRDMEDKNVCVAIELNSKIQDGGTILEVNDVRSIHGREAENLVLPILHNDTLRYVDKKKGLAWLSSASSYYQQEIAIQDLDDAAKIINNFENPTLPSENNADGVDDVLYRSGGLGLDNYVTAGGVRCAS